MKLEQWKKSCHIGQRIIKTAIAVWICFMIYVLRGKQGIPFYSAIAAILCMQPYVENSGKVAMNRVFGTLVGAAYGLVILSMYVYMEIEEIFIYLLISATIILVIKTAVWLNKAQVAYFSCVVFLSIVANHITDEQPFIFVLNRVLDTMIGILVSLAINSFHLPRQKNQDILFVSGLDDTLLNDQGCLTPYSLVELNRLIADGANFTVSTERTPASMLSALSSIHMKLPVITMNGAALYDIENNRYLHAKYINETVVGRIQEMLIEADMGAFYNVISQDTLLIHYQQFYNVFMEKVYQKMRKNPLRNYVCTPLAEGEQVVYLYIIDEEMRIKKLAEKMQQDAIFEEIRMTTGKEKEYPGAAYIKIYDKQATRKNMNAYLAEQIGVSKVITYGSIEGQYDVVIRDGDDNLVVRSMKKLYEPFILCGRK